MGKRRNIIADTSGDRGFFVKRRVITVRRYAVAKEKSSMIIRPATIANGPWGKRNNGKNNIWKTGRK